MSRVERRFIDQYVKANRPDGLGKLSQRTKIPYASLEKIRLGKVIRDPLKIESLTRELGVTEAELFPSDQGTDEAV